MKETLTKESSVAAKVNIELPSSRVNEHLNAFFRDVARHAKIQGFRKGKAPAHVVKKFYAQEAGSHVSEKLVSEALMEVIRKHDLKVILPPTLVAVDSPRENQEFRFEANLDLKPEIPEINLSAIEIEDEEDKPVTDETVMEQLKSQQEQFLHYHELKEDRAVIKTDAVVVSYIGSFEGNKLEAASTEEQELVLGRGHTLPEFEEALVGMKIGEMKDVEVQFPEDHQLEDVKGRKVSFKLSVKKIKEQHLPELDDKLAQKIDSSVSSLEELKQKTKARLEVQENFRRKKALRERVGDALVEKFAFEINDRQKRLTAENMLRDQIQQLARYGFDQEAIKARQTELMEEAAKEADKQIRLAYILEAIARENSLKVEDQDIDNRIKQTAELTGASLEEVKQYYSAPEEGDTPGENSRMDRLKLDVLDEKSLDYALSKAKLKTKGQ